MTTTPTDDLPPLPEPDMWIPHSITELSASYTADQMRAYALADRQARAAQADQCAEVAAALEIRAILEQIKEVAALHPADDMPTPFQSAWQLCCEEIFYRATGQQWHMDEDDGRRNVSGETAGQKIVRAAAQQPAAVVLNPATGDVRFEPEQQSTVQPVALNDRDAVRRWVKSVPAWRDPFTLDSLIVVLKAWEALRVTAPFQPKANPVAPREDALHNAVCNAVSIMNQSMDIARSADGRKAKDVLRQALIDYADWSSK